MNVKFGPKLGLRCIILKDLPSFREAIWVCVVTNLKVI